MQFNTKMSPENPKLKEYFSWKKTAVTESQIKNMINHIADELCMRAMLLCYTSPVDPAKNDEKGGQPVTFFSVTNNKGERYLPVFTDEKELLTWREPLEKENPVKTLIGFDDFLPFLQHMKGFNGFVINPTTDNFLIPAPLVAMWTKQKMELVEKVMAARKEKEQDGVG